MLKSLGNLFRAMIAILTGRADRAGDILLRNPDAMRAEYDKVLSAQREQLREYTRVDGAMRAERERQLIMLEEQTEAAAKHQAGIAAAMRKLQNLKTKLEGEGLDRAAIEAHPEYIKLRGLHRDYSSTLQEKQAAILELKKRIEQDTARIDGNVQHMRQLQRKMEETAAARNRAIANILSAAERERVANMERGIANDKTSERLATLKRIEREAVAMADSAEAVIGTDANRQLEELLGDVETSTHDRELDAALWGEEKPATDRPTDDRATTEQQIDITVPEA